MRRHVRAAALFAWILTLALADARGTPLARRPMVQGVDIEVPFSPAPLRIAGQRHLGYELHVTNFRTADVTLLRVEVVDADRGVAIADLFDAALAARLGQPGVDPAPADPRVVGGGRRAVLFAWLPLDEATPAPVRLEHRIELEIARPSGPERTVVVGGGLEVRADSPLVLGAPLRGGPWVALYDPLLQHGHRTSIYAVGGRARIPARFAVDFIRLDERGAHARGDASRVASWLGYGAEVLAVADGVVADARDDIAEDAAIGRSATPIPLENASGNYVVLDLGGGRHAFYEHLKSGSVRVRAGERVRAGAVIGLLGNTGSSSSGPHLHFHVADATSPLAAEGMPYVFRDFRVLGAYPTIDAFDAGGPWGEAPRAAAGPRRLELPAPNTVVTFDGELAAE